MKHIPYFNDFLGNEVNLNKTRLDKLENKITIIDDFLEEKLDLYISRENQGSYGTKTIIKPPKDKDFDADIMIYVRENKDYEPKEYIEVIYELFQENGNYKDIVGRKSRCVTLGYKDDFHLDIVPCVEIDSKKHVCNRDTNELEITDGTAYKKWLIEKNMTSGNHLKKVIKLLKYLRDIKTTFTCKSILLTTLLGNQINNATFSDLPIALKEICNRLNKFLQDHEDMPIIENPILDDEDFNRHWNQKKYTNFREKFNSYTEKINTAFNEKEHNESVKKWREVFGDNFGELRESESNTSYTTAANKSWSS